MSDDMKNELKEMSTNVYASEETEADSFELFGEDEEDTESEIDRLETPEEMASYREILDDEYEDDEEDVLTEKPVSVDELLSALEVLIRLNKKDFHNALKAARSLKRGHSLLGGIFHKGVK